LFHFHTKNANLIMSHLIRSLMQTTRRHSERRVLDGISPLHLLQVIVDVDSYKEFLPLCQDSKIHEHTRRKRRLNVNQEKTYLHQDENLRCFETYHADMAIGLNESMTEKYTSKVCVNYLEKQIDTESVDGSMKYELFDSIRSRWKLRDVDSKKDYNLASSMAVDVEFDVEIVVSNPLVVGVLDRVLEDVSVKQVRAFEARCRVIPMKQWKNIME